MRITNNMMSYNFLSSLNRSLEKSSQIQEQLADGKSIHRPSDDPVKAVRSLYFTTSKDQNTQFTQNLGDAQSWMNSTDKVMSDMSSVMIKMQELVVSADDTKTPDDIKAIGRQVDEMINQAVQLGNTKIGERYLFGGQNDSVVPFVRKTVQDPQSGLNKEIIEYNGDTNKISMVMQPGAVNPFQDSVNLSGADVFGPATTTLGHNTLAVFDHLMDIKSEMMKVGSVSQTNSLGGIGTVSGTYTGAGYQNFNVRIDNITAGIVDQASYSVDGGNTWTNAVVTAGAATSPSTVALPNGVSFNIANVASNVAHPPTGGSTGDVYSFRVPQTPFAVGQTNAAGGSATVGGSYSLTGSTLYSVKIGILDPVTGMVTGGTNGAGQVTDALYSTDQGISWTKATVTVGNPSTVALPGGVTLNVAASLNTNSSDGYSFSLPPGKGPDAGWLSRVGIDYVDQDHNAQLKVQTELGARLSMYQMANSMMIDQAGIIENDQGNNDGLDIPKAITDFNIMQNLYRSSLAIGGKILPPSLVDFLR